MKLIEKIQIKNYRGIQEGEIDNLKHTNIIVGRNGSGKSTILEALYLLSHAFNPNAALMDQNKKFHSILKRRNIMAGSDYLVESNYFNNVTGQLHIPILTSNCWFGNNSKNDIQIIAQKPQLKFKGI